MDGQMDEKMDGWMSFMFAFLWDSDEQEFYGDSPLNIKAVSPQCVITSLSTDGLKRACQIIRLRASIALRHSSLPPIYIYYIHIEYVTLGDEALWSLHLVLPQESWDFKSDIWLADQSWQALIWIVFTRS